MNCVFLDILFLGDCLRFEYIIPFQTCFIWGGCLRLESISDEEDMPRRKRKLKSVTLYAK